MVGSGNSAGSTVDCCPPLPNTAAASMHPHGVAYRKDAEGAPYFDGPMGEWAGGGSERAVVVPSMPGVVCRGMVLCSTLASFKIDLLRNQSFDPTCSNCTRSAPSLQAPTPPTTRYRRAPPTTTPGTCPRLRGQAPRTPPPFCGCITPTPVSACAVSCVCCKLKGSSGGSIWLFPHRLQVYAWLTALRHSCHCTVHPVLCRRDHGRVRGTGWGAGDRAQGRVWARPRAH